MNLLDCIRKKLATFQPQGPLHSFTIQSTIFKSPNPKGTLFPVSPQSFKHVLPYHLEDNSQNSQTDL